MLKEIISNFFKCKHKNAVAHNHEGYCPDCGEYVRKSYYIVRCKCCGIKRYAKMKFNKAVPIEKFCTNCGTSEYRVEKYETLNLVDINYALEVKETASEFGETENFEIWIENNETQQKEEANKRPMIPKVKYITG